MTSDQIVDEAVAHGVQQAEMRYPPLKMRLAWRISLGVIALLAVFGTVGSTANYVQLHRQVACQSQVTAHGRVVADDDRKLVDQVIEKALGSGKLSGKELAQIKRDYELRRAANDKQRMEIYGKDCR